MTRPGVDVTVVEAPPQREAPTSVDPWFVVGVTERGPAGQARLIHSVAEYVKYYGERVAYGLVYDALDVFFTEGGARAYVSRVVGPAAMEATATLDGPTAACLELSLPPGAYANSWTASVSAPAS